MEFRLEPQGTYQSFRRFEGKSVFVNEICFTNSLVICPDLVIPDWPVKNVRHLAAADLQVILDLKPEVAILGTGSRLYFPSPDLLTGFMDSNVGIDFMDSRAACRTFNILVAEGRNVAAGIILEE